MPDTPLATAAPDYRDTVFLPNTAFAMRGDLPKREPERLAKWQAMDLHAKRRAQSAGWPNFTLHDGPPYANGHLHIGHALNKILKDVINRAQQMTGHNVHYVPGWDCHGLPIEWKVEEDYRAAGRDKDAVPIVEFRAECRAYAARWLAIQAEEFCRLGVDGEFANRYATMDFTAEAAIASEIGRFLLNGQLYRGLRPVLWSTVEKTALAEAEVDYHDHTSTTLFVRFPIISYDGISYGDDGHDPRLAGATVVIWTTTPWTLPANRAIAAGAEIEYALLRVDAVAEQSRARPGEKMLVALALLPNVIAAAGVSTHHLLHIYKGAELAGLVCAHPLRGRGYDFDVPLLLANFVTTEQGSGFVHIAPAHGEDDFVLGQAHGIAITELVEDDGRFAPTVALFAGLSVFKATDPICAALEAVGGLLARGTLVHAYPHSWRSKAPLLFRATPQWFIPMDGAPSIRAASLSAIARTRFVPPSGRNRLASMVATRPDWCISRQRAWGVPIAVFVERASGQPLRDPAVVARIVAAFETEGADAWYTSPPERFLGPDRDPGDYEQVTDIIDVWFESGSSHGFVLEARGMPTPADLYLEGSDQHRGWFQASLLESIGTRGQAPFRTVLTHGFVLDEQGRKMSKSLGNVVGPAEIERQYGADILRLWVMLSDTTDDLRIGPEILKQTSDLYRRLRNTLRWLLGNLHGFSPAEALPYTDLPELERTMLHRLSVLDARMRAASASYEWSGVYADLHHFCASDLSAFYFDVRKDWLYCDRTDAPRRRAARTTLDHILRCLTIWLAPALVFTADEAWCARYGEAQSVHLQTFPVLPPEWHDPVLERRWVQVRDTRRTVTSATERARAEGWLKAPLQAAVTLPDSLALDLDAEQWATLTIASVVTFSKTATEPVIALAPGCKCVRCWRVLPEVGESPAHPTLCRRCEKAVVP